MKKILFSLLILGVFPLGAQIKSKELLKISIQGVPASEQTRINSDYPVADNGSITMWGIGTLQATGQTPTQLAATIAAAYKAKGIYANPTIQVMPQNPGITIKDTITVGGQVAGSGAKPYLEEMTLYDAVSAAGGATPFGALNRVKLFRKGKVYTYNLKKDSHKQLKLLPGDMIEVPEKKWNAR